MKLCPYCSGEINNLAVTCRHCLRMITDQRISSTPVEEPWKNPGNSTDKIDTDALHEKLPPSGVVSTVSSDSSGGSKAKSYTWIIVMVIIMKIGGFIWTTVIVPELRNNKTQVSARANSSASTTSIYHQTPEMEVIENMLVIEDKYYGKISSLDKLEVDPANYGNIRELKAAMRRLAQYHQYGSDCFQEINNYTQSAGYFNNKEDVDRLYSVENKRDIMQIYFAQNTGYAFATSDLYGFIVDHQKDGAFDLQNREWVYSDTKLMKEYDILHAKFQRIKSGFAEKVQSLQAYNIQFFKAHNITVE